MFNVDTWWLPTGGVEPGESFGAAAIREVREETGVEIDLVGLIAGEERIKDGQETWLTLAATARTTDLVIDDPDGKVTDARWVSLEEGEHLVPTHPVGIRQLAGVDPVDYLDRL